jgi:membrane fusion protein, multidrug efflux system
VGPSQGERQAITAGLEPGVSVVVDGSDKLREGAKVTLPRAGDTGPSKGSGDGKGAKHDKSGDKDNAEKRRKKSGDA